MNPTEEALLSLDEAAKQVGVSRSTIDRWIDGGEVRFEKRFRGKRPVKLVPASEVDRLKILYPQVT
jgi:excisionase family DNA binding protein